MLKTCNSLRLQTLYDKTDQVLIKRTHVPFGWLATRGSERRSHFRFWVIERRAFRRVFGSEEFPGRFALAQITSGLSLDESCIRFLRKSHENLSAWELIALSRILTFSGRYELAIKCRKMGLTLFAKVDPEKSLGFPEARRRSLVARGFLDVTLSTEGINDADTQYWKGTPSIPVQPSRDGGREMRWVVVGPQCRFTDIEDLLQEADRIGVLNDHLVCQEVMQSRFRSKVIRFINTEVGEKILGELGSEGSFRADNLVFKSHEQFRKASLVCQSNIQVNPAAQIEAAFLIGSPNMLPICLETIARVGRAKIRVLGCDLYSSPASGIDEENPRASIEQRVGPLSHDPLEQRAVVREIVTRNGVEVEAELAQVLFACSDLELLVRTGKEIKL